MSIEQCYTSHTVYPVLATTWRYEWDPWLKNTCWCRNHSESLHWSMPFCFYHNIGLGTCRLHCQTNSFERGSPQSAVGLPCDWTLFIERICTPKPNTILLPSYAVLFRYAVHMSAGIARLYRPQLLLLHSALLSWTWSADNSNIVNKKLHSFSSRSLSSSLLDMIGTSEQLGESMDKMMRTESCWETLKGLSTIRHLVRLHRMRFQSRLDTTH
jgi:hypothetical protein